MWGEASRIGLNDFFRVPNLYARCLITTGSRARQVYGVHDCRTDEHHGGDAISVSTESSKESSETLVLLLELCGLPDYASYCSLL